MLKLMRVDDAGDDCFVCEEIREAFFDAYLFGDHRLEGLVMRLHRREDGSFAATIDSKLPKHLDRSRIEEDGLAFALTHDVFASTAELADDDCFLWEQGSALPEGWRLR